jgi:very-short-patch-repair endonuclease
MEAPHQLDRHGLFQHGLVTLQQLTDAGTSRQQRRTLTKNGILLPTDHDVYRALGTPTGWEQDLHAACLVAGPDAVASHRAPAVLWKLIDPPAPIEISVPYEQRPLPFKAIRHRSQALRRIDVAVRRHIPVTTPARTLLDLGAVAPRLVPNALERCLYKRLVTTAGLWRLLAELGAPGRRGLRPLRSALERRALGDRRPESLLEPVLAGIAVAAGVELEYQFPVVVEGHRYRLDFALPQLLLAWEVDGLEAHGTREALDSDLERQNRLVRHGWMLMRYTHTHLKRHPRAVRSEILDTIRQREIAQGRTL